MFFNFPTKILFQKKVSKNIVNITKQFGNKLVLVTGKNFLKKSGVLDKILKSYKKNKFKVYHFNKIETNPSNISVNKLINFLNVNKPDFILAIGGGSVIDAAKIANVSLNSTKNCWDYFNDPYRKAKKIIKKELPLIVIPTTSGTGSEITPFSVIQNKKQKLKKGISSKYLFPDISIIDTDILKKMPEKLTASAGADALGQAIESYTSNKSNFSSDFFSYESIKLLSKFLPKTIKNKKNEVFREKIALAALLGGMAITYTETNLAHALAEPLGAEYNLHHGETVGLFTPISIKFNLLRTKKLNKKYFNIIKLFNKNKKYSKQAKQNILAQEYYKIINNFFYKINIKTKISDLKNFNSKINKLSDMAINMGSIKSNMVKLRKQDIKKIYKSVIE